MILSTDDAERLGVERDRTHMNRSLSDIIEKSDLDLVSFERLKKEYSFLDIRNKRRHVYRCSPKCIDIVYKMRKEFNCSEEWVIRAILYHHNEKRCEKG